MADTTSTTLTLWQKISAIGGEISRIEKAGKHDQGWRFARVEDYADPFRQALARHGVAVIPSALSITETDTGGRTKNGTPIMAYRARVEWSISDGTTDPLVVPMEGLAHDMSDKGLNKAMTGCRKNLMLMLLHLSAGDDPDNHDPAALRRDENTGSRETAATGKRRWDATIKALGAAGVKRPTAVLLTAGARDSMSLLDPGVWEAVKQCVRDAQQAATAPDTEGDAGLPPEATDAGNSPTSAGDDGIGPEHATAFIEAVAVALGTDAADAAGVLAAVGGTPEVLAYPEGREAAAREIGVEL